MYGELINEMDSWMDTMEIDYVNEKLTEIADDIRLAQIEVEWEQMMFDRFCSSEFEASHYLED